MPPQFPPRPIVITTTITRLVMIGQVSVPLDKNSPLSTLLSTKLSTLRKLLSVNQNTLLTKLIFTLTFPNMDFTLNLLRESLSTLTLPETVRNSSLLVSKLSLPLSTLSTVRLWLLRFSSSISTLTLTMRWELTSQFSSILPHLPKVVSKM